MDEIKALSQSWVLDGVDAMESLGLTNGSQCNVRKVNLQFKQWTQPVLFDTYNGKPIVEYNTRPMFAEVAVVQELKSQGYEAVWVDTYRNKFWQDMPSATGSVTLSGELGNIYSSVKSVNGSRGGCWDILARNGTDVVFAELKLNRKDKMRTNQIKWLESALSAGLNQDQFIVIEWEYE